MLWQQSTPRSTGQGVNVLLYRDGRLSHRAITDASGDFSFAGVAPGIYGLIAAGAAGYAAFGLDVYQEAIAVRPHAVPDKETLVTVIAREPTWASIAAAVDNRIVVTLLPPSMTQFVQRRHRDSQGTLAAVEPLPSSAGSIFGSPSATGSTGFGSGAGGIGGAVPAFGFGGGGFLSAPVGTGTPPVASPGAL